MKGRESGMPDQAYWETFYDSDCIVQKLGCIRSGKESVVEFGCGYGTFTLPVARRTTGIVYAIDIEPALVSALKLKASSERLHNVKAMLRDFIANGTGLAGESVEHAMAYNILHVEEPVALLKEAWRVLRPGGTISIIHWKHDPSTPRGPSMRIRPTPEQCRAWGEQAGLEFVRDQDLSACCAYHYGLVMQRPS